jgi:hypothetical protein
VTGDGKERKGIDIGLECSLISHTVKKIVNMKK